MSGSVSSVAAAGMALEGAIHLDESDGGKRTVLETGEEVEDIPQMRRPLPLP